MCVFRSEMKHLLADATARLSSKVNHSGYIVLTIYIFVQMIVNCVQAYEISIPQRKYAKQK